MEKKSVSASLLVVYLAVLFAVIGSCFYAFVFTARQITISSVKVISAEAISVFDDEEKTKTTSKLKLSDMKTGIRPATGKIDKETQIPSTINDEGTTEGYYAMVFVETSANYKVLVKNIKIESEKDELLVKEERKNIFIAIKDVANSTKNFEEDEFEIASFSDIQEIQKHTFLIWLGASTGDDLQGASITFDIEFALA